MSKKSRYVLLTFLTLLTIGILKPKAINAAWVCTGSTGCWYWESHCWCAAKWCYLSSCWTKLACEGFLSKNCTSSCSAAGCGTGNCGRDDSCSWQCSPSCAGKECGVDSCGQSCGSCSGGETCISGQCVTVIPVCNTTAPTNLVVTRLSPTQARLNWTPGLNGTNQLLRVGANLTEVNSGCPGTGSPACVVKEDNLLASLTSYTTPNVLVPGTVYYWRVVTYKDASCYSSSTNAISVSSCDLTPDSFSLQIGSSGTLITMVNASGEIQSVNYTSANTAIASVNPASDTTVVYQTSVTGVSANSTTVRSDVMIGGVVNCTDSSNITVTAPDPWWQVRDSDVSTNGDLISLIPATCILPGCNPFFNLRGTGGFPGVTLVGGNADFAAGSGTGNAAEAPYNWLVNSSYQGKTYDYAYFARQVPSDVPFTEVTENTVNGGFFQSGGVPSRGYVWYHYNGSTLGDLTMIGNLNLNGTRRVVLLIEGADFYLDGNINIQLKGQGFFMVVVGKNANGLKGNIFVDPSVSGSPSIEGLFLTEGTFYTGAGTNQLHVLGSVVAYDGIALERDLGQPGNNTTPSELFEYSPELMSVFPQVFTSRRMRWKEVAP